MRLIKAQGDFFQSYKHVEFNYEDLGPVAITGDQGAGKSTVPDLAAWILFGRTSKDSSADAVRSWYAEDGDVTSGTAWVEIKDGAVIIITRKRGKRSAQNDLFFFIERNTEHGASEPTRGKDATDTQRLINEALGVDHDLYSASSYIHQFSDSDQFFVVKPKERRAILEKISDQSFAINVAEKTSEARKAAKAAIVEEEKTLARTQGTLDSQDSVIKQAQDGIAQWESDHKRRTESLTKSSNEYLDTKAKKVEQLVGKCEVLAKMIKPAAKMEAAVKAVREKDKALEAARKEHRDASSALAGINTGIRLLKSQYDAIDVEQDGPCPTCMGSTADSQHVRQEHKDSVAAELEELVGQQIELEERLIPLTEALNEGKKLPAELQAAMRAQSENNRLIQDDQSLRMQLKGLKDEANPYAAQLKEHLAKSSNPYTAKLEAAQKKQADLEEQALASEDKLNELRATVSSLTWLYDKSFELRGKLLASAVQQINKRMNDALERFFDATQRISLALPDSDKLEVTLTNKGYPCSYADLSGGERCLLKLVFKLAYMKAASNKASVKFDSIVLDEFLNGLDPIMKVRAYGLIESLAEEYGTVIVIDHHVELLNMFPRQFHVENSVGWSSIAEVEHE